MRRSPRPPELRDCECCGSSFKVPSHRPNARFCKAACRYATLRRPAAERFWEKVDKTATCWVWTAATNGVGYGKFNAVNGGPQVYAHRFSYELLVGPIPPGLQLDHLCLNPPCVNPAHLEPVTQAENMRRARAQTVTIPKQRRAA